MAERGLRRLLREPLLGFTLVAAVCFLLWSGDTGPERVEVTAAVVDALVDDYRMLNGTDPDADTRRALVERWVEDEILFREALREGLHLGDARLRHRLIDKMRFLLTTEPEPPAEAELVNHYAAHIERFYTERQYSFVHLFLEQPPADPQGLLARLRAGEVPVGDPFWLGDRFTAYDASILRGMFGIGFVEALAQLEPGRWQGPLNSTQGTHFVRLDGVREPTVLPYAQVREAVLADWMARRRAETLQSALAPRRERYEVERAP